MSIDQSSKHSKQDHSKRHSRQSKHRNDLILKEDLSQPSDRPKQDQLKARPIKRIVSGKSREKDAVSNLIKQEINYKIVDDDVDDIDVVTQNNGETELVTKSYTKQDQSKKD